MQKAKMQSLINFVNFAIKRVVKITFMFFFYIKNLIWARKLKISSFRQIKNVELVANWRTEEWRRRGLSMFPFGCWIIFALTVAIFDNLEAVSVVKHHHDDEYLLEHRVIYQDAINKAHNLTLYPGKFRTFLFLPPTIKKNTILKLASTLSVKNNLLEPKLLLKFT